MSLVDDDGDIFGSTSPQTVRPARRDRETAPSPTLNLAYTEAGQSLTWFVQEFGHSRAKTIELLAGCKPIGQTKQGHLRWRIKDAAAFLVKPRLTLGEFLQNVQAKDLPIELREGFWNAKLKEQKFRVLAGELWTTEAVMEVLGETFKTLKKTTQLWTDTIDETTGLTDQQRQTLLQLVDRLLDELHRALVRQAKSSATESQLQELEELEADVST